MIQSTEDQMNCYQILNEQGEVDEARLAALNLSQETLNDMYQWMVKARLLDKRFLTLQRQGRIGTYAPFSGQEAAQIGSALALKKQDWMFPSYRDLAACLVHGLSIEQALLYCRGHLHGSQTPADLHVFPIQIIIAGQIPQASGCAWASKLKGEDSVSICYFGDGATSEGDFHEGLNFAAVYQLPAIFFCQNNQWAISVPLHKQMASQSIAGKAAAFGMKGVQVDGNDILAVYQVTQEAVQRAKNGEGPTLIEAVTYRQGPHTTADDPTKYRDQAEVQKWTTEKDPLARFEAFLSKRGMWSEEVRDSYISQFEAEVNEAIALVEEAKPLTTDVVFDYVYETMHEQLSEQKAEVSKRIKERG